MATIPVIGFDQTLTFQDIPGAVFISTPGRYTVQGPLNGPEQIPFTATLASLPPAPDFDAVYQQVTATINGQINGLAITAGDTGTLRTGPWSFGSSRQVQIDDLHRTLNIDLSDLFSPYNSTGLLTQSLGPPGIYGVDIFLPDGLLLTPIPNIAWLLLLTLLFLIRGIGHKPSCS